MKTCLVFAILIAFKVIFTVSNPGSFIDEYLHIKAAMTNFEWTYLRGQYVSYAIILGLNWFGQKLFVFKLIPCCVGIINTILLYLIAKNINLNQKYRIILLIIYTLSPWVIFNHFYIRTYVFLEFAIYSVILCLTTLEQYKNNLHFLSKLVLILTTISIITLYFNLTIDISRGLPIVIFLILVFAQLFFNFNPNLQCSQRQSIAIGSLLFIFTFLALVMQDKIIIRIADSPFLGSIGSDYKFLYYFFKLNIIITVFFVIGVIYALQEETVASKLIAIIGSTCLVLHSIAGYDYQLLRTIFYFHGIYYLLAVYGVAKLVATQEIKLIEYIAYFLLFLTIILNYPNDFYTYPRVPGEIDYRDYKNAFAYIDHQQKEQHLNYYCILALPQGISNFYHYHPLHEGISPLEKSNQEISNYVVSFLNSRQSSILLIDQEGYSALHSGGLLDELKAHSQITEFYGHMIVFERKVQTSTDRQFTAN